MLSFFEVYLGYNQIRMDSTNEDKTSYIIESENYCYKVMLFGLKIVKAIYQRLMDKVFNAQLGKNLEVYVDDIVAKSDDLSTHIKNLEKVFENLWKHNMRLNPNKYFFGVEGGKFLGFMLTQRGIQANLDKCQTILEMRSPGNIKEAQRLADRIASLSRFLPRIIERAKSIMNLLKKR